MPLLVLTADIHQSRADERTSNSGGSLTTRKNAYVLLEIADWVRTGLKRPCDGKISILLSALEAHCSLRSANAAGPDGRGTSLTNVRSSSMLRKPTCNRPLMKKVGVPRTSLAAPRLTSFMTAPTESPSLRHCWYASAFRSGSVRTKSRILA